MYCANTFTVTDEFLKFVADLFVIGTIDRRWTIASFTLNFDFSKLFRDDQSVRKLKNVKVTRTYRKCLILCNKNKEPKLYQYLSLPLQACAVVSLKNFHEKLRQSQRNLNE